MRKAILSVLCCAAVALAAIYSPGKAAAAPAPTAAADLTRQLEHVTAELRRANDRLAGISAGFIEPPEPDKPAVQAALNGVATQANETLRLVADIQSRIH